MGTEGANFRVIAGRYRLQGRIGRGGMGVVWRATDQLLGRQVAVKELVIDPSLSERDSRRQRERTLREARAVAQLSHPNIVVVHDVVEDDTHPYIVMELIDGGSLEDRIAAQGPVNAREAARIGIDLLGALRKAHDSGVLHRDLKPANVLFEEGTGRIVLTDFGIAQLPGSTTLTESGAFVGSPEYTAPERMSGARTGPESDLWSLGALLCAALSGESPFRRDSLGEVLHAVVADEIRPPAQAAPLLPVVLGLLERDPAARLGAAEAEHLLRAYRETGRMPHTPRVPLGHLPRDARVARDARDAHGFGAASGTSGAGSASGAGGAGTGGRPGAGVGLFGLGAGYRDGNGTGSGNGNEGGGAPGRISWKGAVIAAALVAAMAGAGVSAVALLMREGGDGGGPPASSGPRTPTSTTSTTDTTGATDATGTTASPSTSPPATSPSGPPTPSSTRTEPPTPTPTPTVTSPPATASAVGPVVGTPEGLVIRGNVLSER